MLCTHSINSSRDSNTYLKKTLLTSCNTMIKNVNQHLNYTRLVENDDVAIVFSMPSFKLFKLCRYRVLTTTTIRNDTPPMSSSLSCRPLPPSLYLRCLLRFFLHTEFWYSTMVTDIAYGLDIVWNTIAASDFAQNSPLSHSILNTHLYTRRYTTIGPPVKVKVAALR